MHGEDLLGSFIEVGIGIAGFSSIVVALSRSVITEDVKLAFLQLWIQSVAIILFSSLPLLLNSAGVASEYIYVVASALYGTYLTLVFIFTPTRKRFRKHRILMVGFTFPVFLFVNAALLGVSWIYLAVILGGISIAFLSFYQLIKLTWATGAEP